MLLFRYLIIEIIIYGAEIWGGGKRKKHEVLEKVCKVVLYP